MNRMMFGLALTAGLLCAALDLKAQVAAPSDPAGLVAVESANNVAETERHLVAALEAAKLKVAARGDHAFGATASEGEKLRR